MADVKVLGDKRKMTEGQLHIIQEINTSDLCSIISSRNSSLEDEIRRLKNENKLLGERCNQLLTDKGKLTDENAELKSKIGLSIDCEKAQKNGELCLGYSGDEDEPCERCKNCIKCESGTYQLGETEKDDQRTKAKELINRMLYEYQRLCLIKKETIADAKQFLREIK